MERAYSILEVKSVDVERRYIAGIATTPETDRHGDIVDVMGCTFRNPIPLLLHHDKTQPVGRATLSKATAAGIPFEAFIPFVTEPGIVRDRVDEAWHSVKAGLMMGVSIAFRILDDGIEKLKSGGLHFKKTEILELSLVTIPANASASIQVIKTLFVDQGASAHQLPAVAGTPNVARRNAPPMNTAEQITHWSNTRAPMVARMSEIMAASADNGATLDESAATEYDGLDVKVKGIDAQLSRLRNLEASNAAVATPITAVTRQADASAQRGGHVVSIRPNVPKGTAFVRSAMALLRAKGDTMRALDYAKAWHDSTPEVELMIKAAVAPGSTTDPVWAGVLVQVQNATNEFLELLRPATILGKIPNLRQVPFNTQVPLQTGGGTYGWVGQGAPKPVTKLALGTTSIGFAKAAGIIVITEELAKLSSPSAEAIVRADMIGGISQFLDAQFIDPAVAAVANVNPASITNGALTVASSDDPVADLGSLLSHFAQYGYPLSSITLIMNETNALAMGMMRDAAGNKLFPSMGVGGGSVEGFNVVASNAAGANVIALSGPDILFADEGGIAIDVSREASVLMDSAPMNPADATAVYTSLWQNNLVGLRAERMVNWVRARQPAVKYLTDASYAFATGGAVLEDGGATRTGSKPGRKVPNGDNPNRA
jgi:HK97 family phage major capsid protein/HK97 family phage prohead protease